MEGCRSQKAHSKCCLGHRQGQGMLLGESGSRRPVKNHCSHPRWAHGGGGGDQVAAVGQVTGGR